jgi:arginase
VDRPLSVSALLCRTSERGPHETEGARALGELLGARMIGSPQEPRDGTWEEDLRDARGCLLEAGGQVDDALEAGRFPVLLAGHCSVCITTLPAVLRHRPDARVLWLDAHGDFNTPETSGSGFLGGMCLAAACGVWDAGLGDGPALDPAHVAMVGVRDLDPGERGLVETRGVGRLEPRDLEPLHGRPVYVHLDCDVLDAAINPASFPAPGGFDLDTLGAVIAEVAERCEVIGLEVTALHPRAVHDVADVLAPLTG